MAFKIVFDKRFKKSGRYASNILGRIIVFEDGIGYADEPEVADYAAKLRHISHVEKIKPVIEEAPIEEPVKEEEQAEEVPENIKENVEGFDEAEDTPEEEAEEPEEEEEEEEKEEAPAEEASPDVQKMYDDLGTWKAVADELGISTTELRKLREEQGLL